MFSQALGEIAGALKAMINARVILINSNDMFEFFSVISMFEYFSVIILLKVKV